MVFLLKPSQSIEKLLKDIGLWSFFNVQYSELEIVKEFSTGFPELDFTNHEVTIRCSLLVTEGNGFLINGAALKNLDTIPLMPNEATYDANSKSTGDEFIYIFKNRLI